MINKTYSTLFTRDTLGNIRLWWMEQKENKYRTHSGIQDGQIVISEWTEVEGKNIGKKNATTSEQQASSEIDAKYKKQLKTGYHKSIKDVDKHRYVEPMLAKLYKDYASKIELEKGKWAIQCKFNGMRCVATKEGLFTRKGEKYISVPHIEKSLEPFFAKYPDAVLDGELFNNELRQQLNEISKLIRKTKHITSDDFDRSEKLVKYYVYDGYNFDCSFDKVLNIESPYSERKQWIDENLVDNYKYVVQVPTIGVNSQEKLDELYQSFVDDGQEGAILRNIDMPYENKRSKNLLKVKPEDDDEGVIVNITEGSGNWKKTGKIITLMWQEKTFDATFKGTFDQGVQFLKDKNKWIGKTVTFLYNGLTGLGTPNYARVDINNCIKGDR